jgi:hypothetical protein
MSQTAVVTGLRGGAARFLMHCTIPEDSCYPVDCYESPRRE